jgi:hypothetical protein
MILMAHGRCHFARTIMIESVPSQTTPGSRPVLENESHEQVVRKSAKVVLRTAFALLRCLKNGFSIFESPASDEGCESAI